MERSQNSADGILCILCAKTDIFDLVTTPSAHVFIMRVLYIPTMIMRAIRNLHRGGKHIDWS